MNNKSFVFFILLVITGCQWVSAGRLVSLEECIRSALALNPSVNAAALKAEKARILKSTAFNPPNTEVTLKQETTGGGGPENGVFFGQEFDFPSIYVARHRLLSSQADLESARFDLMTAEVEHDVTSTFFSIAYYQRLLQLSIQLDSIYEEFCRVAAVRLEAGEAGRLELINAERVREKNDMERRTIYLELNSNMLDLRRLTGISEATGVLTEKDFSPLPYDAAEVNRDFGGTLRGKEARLEILSSKRESALARNELLPGIRIGATAQAVIKSFNPYHVDRSPFRQGNFMGFEVGVTVPLFFGAGVSRIKAAEADSRIALLDMDAKAADSQKELNDISSRLSSLSMRLEYYAGKACPRADEMKRLSEVSYSLGDIDYFEYIANMESAFEIYREYADCINEFNQAVINLTYLVK